MYEVFINNKPLVIVRSGTPDRYREGLKKIETTAEAVNPAELTGWLHADQSIRGIIVVCPSPSGMMKQFFRDYKLIEAAGGLVHNPEGKILFIYRNDKWDLPKGKLEDGEQPDRAALREVEEETHVSGLTILRKLKTTYHTYSLEFTSVLKKTYWFEMNCRKGSSPKPQQEEGIEEVKWMNPVEIRNALKNTYPLIEGLVNEYLKRTGHGKL